MSDVVSSKTRFEAAVIGMAGRFPGARHIDEFWNNLVNGVESVAFFSEEELKERGLSFPGQEKSHLVKLSPTLEGMEYFDASFFGYTPHEVEVMDPQVRLLHEIAWEALEDAGYYSRGFSGITGFYAGAAPNSNWEGMCLLSAAAEKVGQFTMMQLMDKDYMCTRVSYALGLTGPSLVVSSACSTSLAALHLAFQALLNGECHMALAGGISIGFPPALGYIYEEGMTGSPDGHCRAFDANARGTFFQDGGGMVVLKHMDDALEDGDHIYAVIKSSAMNNDGARRVGYTAPSIDGQAEVIRAALEQAEVEPGSIAYVETHGTGTALGDPIEIAALNLAFNTAQKGYCRIGTVKSNIGHLNAAAGAAGFIKTVLALKNRLIPPSLHFETPNPGIDFENSPFRVNTQLHRWQRDNYPLRAGVSSFGIGGTNVHVILEEPPPAQGARRIQDSPLHSLSREYHLILLSAKTETALERMTANLAGYLQANPGINLADAAYTLQVGRKEFQYRRKLVCSTVDEAAAALTSLDPRKIHTGPAPEGKKFMVFLFPGLGQQYVGMGWELYRCEPVFQQEMDRCFQVVKSLTGKDLKEILYPAPGPSGSSAVDNRCDIDRFDIAQLVIFIFEYSLAGWLKSLGIVPQAMMGYSSGEYTAACLSGVFSLEDALDLLVARGKSIQELPRGMMISVPLAAGELAPLLSAGLAVGIDNGASCVVSGPPPETAALVERLKEKKLLCVPLGSSRALHSPMMEPVLEEFAGRFGQVTLTPPRIPYISTVTGDWITVEDAASPAYWARQMKETVYFARGLEKLLENPETLFLEVGPGHDLSLLVKRQIENTPYLSPQPQPQVINLVPPRERGVLPMNYTWNRIGQLWLEGVPLDWTRYYRGEKRYRVSLPTYPFEVEQQRFWGLWADYRAGRLQDPVLSKTPGKKDMADRFYIPSWKCTVSPLSLPLNHHPKQKQYWWIFLDDCGMGVGLVPRLEQRGDTVITIKKGSGFYREEENSFVINPSEKKDYHTLVAALSVPDREPAGFSLSIIHMWTLTGESFSTGTGLELFKAGQEIGYYSILFLVQALCAHGFTESVTEQEAGSRFPPIAIEVVSNQLHGITGKERLCPEKSTVLGLCRTVPQEFANIACRSIDFEIPGEPILASMELSELAARLTAEILSPVKDIIVAYRGNSRWVQHFEPFRLEHSEESPPCLEKQGVYLITGGLGNDGFIRSKYLAQTVNARLVLTGRTPLPARQEWSQYLDSRGHDDPVSIKIRRVLELEKSGAEVLAITADVCSEVEMKAVIEQIDRRFGRLNGVIHGAGNTSVESLRTILKLGADESDWHFKPKIYGLYVLEKVLAERPLDFCILTSSVAAITGGLGRSAYTAASVFMDAYTHWHNRDHPAAWLSLNWQGTSGKETVEAFERLLSLTGLNQVLFSEMEPDQLIRKRTRVEYPLDSPGKETGWPSVNKTGAIHRRPVLSDPYAPARDELEKKLVELWQDFLGIDKIGIHDNFFELGGDSLKGMTLVNRYKELLGEMVYVEVVFEAPTIAQLAAFFTEHFPGAAAAVTGTGTGDDEEALYPKEKESGYKYAPLEAVEKKEYYSLSSSQERFYFFHQVDPAAITYNSPQTITLETELDKERLEQTFIQSIRRHESLRTSFEVVSDQPVQKVHQQVEFAIESYDFNPGAGEENRAEGGNPISIFIGRHFIRAFDLSRAPLLRVGLVRVDHKNQVLFMDLHHIVSDALSAGILTREFAALYNGGTLPALKLQYKDYAQWQKGLDQEETMKQQEAYWLKLFTREPLLLDLPLDYPRPLVQRFEGNTLTFVLSPDWSRTLKAAAQETGTTLYMVILALFNVFLSKLSGSEDIVVGTPISQRFHQHLQNIVGAFINILPMRNFPTAEKTFAAFLQEVKQQTLDAYRNQDYPFEYLVEKLAVNRDTSRNPIFDVMLNLFTAETIAKSTYSAPSRGNFPGSAVDSIRKSSMFDISLTVRDEGEQLYFNLEYAAALFRSTTIARFSEYLKQALAVVPKNLSQQLFDIDIMPLAEKERLLRDFNCHRADFPTDKTIYHFLEQQAGTGPGKTALEYRGSAVTYGHLNAMAQRLAGDLKAKGVSRDRVIGIQMDRSPLMAASILAAWKSGGAYLPLDPRDPRERIDYMLADSGADLLVTSGPILPQEVEKIPGANREKHLEIISIDTYDFANLLNCPPNPSPGSFYPWSLAYVIYTSGSTGKPKGVMVEHIGMMNHMQAKLNDLGLNETSIVAQNASHTFDISVWQFFAGLVRGGKVVIYANTMILEPLSLLNRLIKDRITILEVVPSYLAVMLDTLGEQVGQALSLPLEYLLVTGEEIKPHLVTAWFKKYPYIKMVNAYGPTEASDDITHYIMEKAPGTESPRIPIGKPLQNLNIYIVDKHMKLCPIGVQGEIWVSGVGVGRGYINDIQRTARMFAKDRFAPGTGTRLYKSGDIGRWLPDGTIEFLGRKDYQVKIRGFRIEMEEIENRLLHYPGIMQAVVVNNQDQAGSEFLCAYFVARPEARESLEVLAIKNYLRQYLPAYMVPSCFIRLEQMPLTPSGKIHRQALPEPVDGNRSGMIYVTEEMLEELSAGGSPTGTGIEKAVSDGAPPGESIITAEEKQTLVYSFNNTDTTYPADRPFHCLFEEQARQTPGKIALVFEDRQVTYNALNRKSNRLAAALRNRGIKKDCLVGLMVHRSLEMILGILGILKAGGAYLPMEPEQPHDRIRYMLKDSSVHILLTNIKNPDAGFGEVIRHCGCQTLDPGDKVIYRDNPGNPRPISDPSDLIYVIYTSGTTGKPKGVMIQHQSVVNFAYAMIRELDFQEKDVILSLSTVAWDMVGTEIFPPLISGMKVAIGNSEEQMNVRATATLMARERITVLQVTPSALRSFITDSEAAKQLKRLPLVLVGADVFPASLLEQARGVTPARIYNLYGPTETTTWSTAREVTHEPSVDIGKPIANTRVYILDRGDRLLPLGAAGELCIGGHGVTRGYLNNIPLTAAKVTKNPFVKGDKIYRTGDQARWLPDGNIVFLGRKDHQVQVRGIRIELEEIETYILTHKDIEEAVVVPGQDSSGDTYLYACVVSGKKLAEKEIREYLSRELPLYMIPSFFIQLEKMPLTANGKINRKLLETIDIRKIKQQGRVLPSSEVEKKLLEIWQEVLNPGNDDGIHLALGIDDNFFEWGGHSLRAAVMVSRVHKRLNIKLPLIEVFNRPTIRELAEYINDMVPEQLSDIEPVEQKRYYPLSSAQKRMFISRQLDFESVVYNMTLVRLLDGAVDREKLNHTFRQLILRHDSLRTSFTLTIASDEPVQEIHPTVDFHIDYYDLTAEEDTHQEQEKTEVIINRFVRPFDLSHPPLLRVGVISMKQQYLLILDMHHITCDGISFDILEKDFMRLYRGETPPPLKLQYKDYSQWQNRSLKSGTLKKQEDYWLRQFKDGVPFLDIPTDFPPPRGVSFESDNIIFNLEEELTHSIKMLMGESGTTLYMFLLAILNIFLSKTSGQEDIVVGTAVGARRHPDLENIMGIFVNLLPIRNRPIGSQSFTTFLEQVKHNILAALENQEYPFDRLVMELGIEREPGKSPMFDIQFTVQNMIESKHRQNPPTNQNGQQTLKPYKFQNEKMKFSLSFVGKELHRIIEITLMYKRVLFKRTTVERMSRHLMEIIKQVTADPGILLKDIALSHHFAFGKPVLEKEESIDFGF